ncbi:corrinoid protein [bacterium]|nr:corrinoid protein [bacterium]
MLEAIRQAVIEGDADLTVQLVEEALEAGMDPQTITDDGLTSGLRTVGELFDRGEYFVPEMLISADAMEQAMVIIKPLLAVGGFGGAGTVVMGTIKGDLHDIGKNLVVTLLEGAGFNVIDLGVDVPIEKYIAAIEEHDADVVGIGALLTTVLPAMERAVTEIKAHDPDVKVMVGGAAVTAETGDRFGADGYASNAKQAADLALQLMAG